MQYYRRQLYVQVPRYDCEKYLLLYQLLIRWPITVDLCNPCCAPKPLIMPNFIGLGQTVYEKSVTIFFNTLHYFGAPGGIPGPKFTSLGGDGQSLRPLIPHPSVNTCTRYLLPNFVDFVDCVTDKKLRSIIVPHTMRRLETSITQYAEPSV